MNSLCYCKMFHMFWLCDYLCFKNNFADLEHTNEKNACIRGHIYRQINTKEERQNYNAPI